MKKFKLLILALFAFLFLVGCGEPQEQPNQPDQPDDPIEEKEVKINVTPITTIELGESVTIQATLENSEGDLSYTTSEPKIISVNKNGLLRALDYGKSKITISVDGSEVTTELEIEVVKPTFELQFNGNYVYEYSAVDTYKLEYDMSNSSSIIAGNGFNYASSDENVITIDKTGKISTVNIGKATITITSKLDSSYEYTVEVEVKVDPIKVLSNLNIGTAMYQEVTSYGSTTIKQYVRGSVNLYTPMELNVIEQIVPITNSSPYAGKTATEALCQEAESANKYMRSGILHTSTSKITYHDTGNNNAGANADMHAKYLVSTSNLTSRARSWHYTVDDTCAIHHIPDNEVTWQGDNYLAYSTSIGIETCVNSGSELEVVWHRTAKLMASLLVKYNMGVEDIVQHNAWSGKNCPQTLRMNNLYEYAINMVKAEYTVITLLKDYTVTFKSLAPDYLNDNGHVIALPDTATEVPYIVTISNGSDYNESVVLYSVIPGKDGTKKVAEDNTKIREVTSLLSNITKDNYKDILAKYDVLNENDKARFIAVDYLLDTIKSVVGGTVPQLSIEEVYVGTDLRYQYIEIKNNDTKTNSLRNFYLKLTNSKGEETKITLKGKEIQKTKSAIIFAGVNEEVTADEVIYPDAAINAVLDVKGKIELYNNEDKLIDSVTYDTSLTRIAYTGDGKVDFFVLAPSPVNLKDEVYGVRDGVNYKIIDVEVAILKIPSPVTKADGDAIDHAYDLYNALSTKEKQKVRNFTSLKNIKTQYDSLQ